MLTSMTRSVLASFLVGTVLLVMSGCDFNAASDAFDEFDIVVELPPLATVVNVQAIDASTDAPVSNDVRVTFEGNDASEVWDIYSDPIDQLVFADGFASFGLDSTRSPSSDDPARLRLRVQADGYVPTSVPVRITREGSITRTIRLTPDNPEQAPAGTQGRRQRTPTTNGVTTSDVELHTDPTSDEPSAAQASASIPQGTTLKTADGAPLQGQVTTDLSVYDNSADAQNLLPAEALENSDGSRRLIQGALRFHVADESGQRAGQFDNAEGNSTSITADLPALRPENGTPVLVFVNPETGETTRVTPDAASPALAGTAKAHGGWHLSINGDRVTITSPSGLVFGPISVRLLSETISTFGMELPNTCAPAGELVVNRNGQSGSIDISFASQGLSVEASFSDASDAVVITPSDLFDGPIPDIGPVEVAVTAPDDQSQTVVVNWCSGSAETTLPAPATDRIDAAVELVPDCPAGQSIPVSGTVDGYTVNYRTAGSNDPYRSVAKDNIEIFTSGTPTTFDRALVKLFAVTPGQDYEFIGTLGSEGSSRQTLTMPTQDGEVLQTTDAELNDLCE
jgi:hypothetical protein